MVINWKHKSVLKLIEEKGTVDSEEPVSIVKSLARETVLQAFTKEWTGPPYNIIELATMLGFDVMPNDSVSDARITPKAKGQFLIEYNPFHKNSRINFSIAHEIGHTLFSDCSETIRHRSLEMEDSSWELEFLCNIIASEFLLPYGTFREHANKIELTLDNLINLANLYEASLECVFIRFCEVVEKPCMIMLTRFNSQNELVLDYTLKSDNWNHGEIDGEYVIPKTSKAYDCVKSGWTSHNLEEWSFFNEKKHRVYSIGLPSIRKQTQQRVGIFIVPEEFDSYPIREIYEVNGDATLPRGIGNKIIAQVVNTSAGLGFGFGKAMAKRYPITKKKLDEWKGDKANFILGETQLVQLTSDIFAFQMVAQHGIFPKYGEIPLKYSSLQKCLNELAIAAQHHNASVHMPYIGAGQAKGDWGIIKGIIFEELIKKNISVTVYKLPGSPKVISKKSLELFDN